jgi:hypothetical protein
MIVIKLNGGLGNQLFQYAFGRYLASLFKTNVKFDLQFNSNGENYTLRELGLTKFKIDLDIASHEEINNYKLFKNSYLSRFERKLSQLIPFINKRISVEKPFEKIRSFRDNCYYDGYWQSENYFKPIKDIIRKDLTLNFDLDEANKKFATEISKSTTSISLHVRRGDYLSIESNAKIFNVCDLDYYLRAIEIVKEKIPSPIFYIFSDDIIWAKEIFKDNNFKIVDINPNNPNADMYLMSQCKHNIIANSTFSWWGAWLNTNNQKLVIAPNKWYLNNKLNTKCVRNLIPENWLVI